jgi:CxxC-x17-CxxC domain-containing protein
MSEITFFAKTNFRNQERSFGIKVDDRRRHMYIIGKTGMGKTNLLENLVVQDIRNGHGVAYVDPHGDTAEKLIKMIPSNRINDVVYFNPADQDFPIAFNVMEKVDSKYRPLVASGLVGVFKKIWADSWGPRLEYILRNAILALLEYPGATLLGVMRILVDKSYRDRVVAKVTDPVVKSFWVDEYTKWNDRVLQEVVSPIQNKVGQFLSSALIRNIVGQTKSSFDIRDIMDNRKILILNLSKGRIGEDNSALIGAMMITKIQLAAMGRVDTPEEERKDFYLYVDEFQNFATESFANILSEARKYRLNLILANQYITQIDEIVRDSIFGNAGTLVSFRVGAVDAEYLEKEYAPIFMATDLVNLPKYSIYLKLMIDGIAGDAFSAITLSPIEGEGTKINEEKVINVSRERYASSREEVEDKINRWSGMIAGGELEERTKEESKTKFRSESQPRIQKMRSEALPEKTYDNNLFDAACDTCGVEIKVPFKPDGKRPTFCKDCLRDYQRYIAKAKLKDERHANSQNVETSAQIIKRPMASDYEKRIEPKVMESQDAPIVLSQIQHMEPKKFIPKRPKPDINIKELRDLINQSKNKNV